MVRSHPPLLFSLVLFTWSSSAAMDAAVLTPRIGETTQEFEARKRGVRLAPTNRDTVIVAADKTGHFIVDPVLDGKPIRMIVDTGATVMALTYEDAERMGFRPTQKDFVVQVSTANGVVNGAVLQVGEVKIDDITVHQVEALVLPRGSLEVSLLGMSFLKRLSGFDISQERLRLRR